jgi:class 3 adenylate cyclase
MRALTANMKKDPLTKPLPLGYLAFMFTDIVGCTGMIDRIDADSTSDRTEAFLQQIKRPHDKIIKEKVTLRAGVIVKSTGDGFFVVFTDLEKAVLCGVEIQKAIKEAKIRTPDGRLEIRIGLNSGQALLNEANDDYTCPAADKAKHVEGRAMPGAVYLSSNLCNDVKGKVRSLDFLTAGFHPLKHLPEEELFAAVYCTPAQPPEDEALGETVVLIGDPNDARFEWFHNMFAEVYQFDSIQAKTLEEINALVRTFSDPGFIRLILLTDSLPLSAESQKADPRINFNQLDEFLGAEFGCLVTKLREPKMDGVEKEVKLIHVRSSPPDRKQIVDELSQIRRIRPVEVSPRATDKYQTEALRKITEWDQEDVDKRRRLRSLSELYDLEDGYNQLLRVLCHSLEIENLENVAITMMGQSEAGATVFRLIVSRAGQKREFMFRLLETLSGLEQEVREYHEAQSAAANIPNYPSQVGILELPVSPLNPYHPEQKFIVHTGQWFAIHYDLDNEGLAEFLDLNSALTLDPKSLQQRTKGTQYEFASGSQNKLIEYRVKVFTTVLNQICEVLYGDLSCLSREQKAKWKIAQEKEDQHGPFPPYLIMPCMKGSIQDFLDSRDAVIGARLFIDPDDDWAGNVGRVQMLVSDTCTEENLGRLGGNIPFTLSPVHGDLNANNVLLWLEQDRHPFVIDLPSYQKDGHCLQDFARLEVEIKLALLDRQEESPITDLAAYDYSPSQVRLWIELENQLLTDQELTRSKARRPRDKQMNWHSAGYQANVELCYRLVRLLRQKAYEVQQKKVGDENPVPFADEYLPALLYHSLQAISYPSLSIFKRLLAVYTSGSIFKKLK